MKRLLPIIVTLFLTADLYSQSIVTQFKFHQIHFVDEEGYNESPKSSYGYLELDLIYHPIDMYYLNLQAQGISGSAWLIKNYPIFPQTIGQAAPKQGIDFDISKLGYAWGDTLGQINYNYSMETSPQTNFSATFGGNSNVVPLYRYSYGSRINGPNLGGNLGMPFGYQADAAPQDIIQHKNVPEVQEDSIQCLPGSMARSIKWLGMENKFAGTLSAQEIYDILVGFDNPTRLSYENFVAKKDSFLKTLNPHAKTKVLDLNNSIGPITGVQEQTGLDLKDYLKSELPKGDVELHYDKHIITVTGMYSQGGKCFIKYRDDESQGDDTKGDKAEKTGELKKNGAGKYEFKGSTGAFWEVQAAITEYLDSSGSSNIERLIPDFEAQIYPNPVQNIVNLNIYSGDLTPSLITITDITGKEWLKMNQNILAGNNEIQIDLSHLASGLYYMKILDNNNSNFISVKLIKR